jgi:hypothetical protein
MTQVHSSATSWHTRIPIVAGSVSIRSSQGAIAIGAQQGLEGPKSTATAQLSPLGRSLRAVLENDEAISWRSLRLIISYNILNSDFPSI